MHVRACPIVHGRALDLVQTNDDFLLFLYREFKIDLEFFCTIPICNQ